MKQFLFPVFLLLSLFGCRSSDREVFTIAAASNMQFAMKELVRTFRGETRIPVRTVTGSSGQLTAQIRKGAPFDLFFSADMKYPRVLEKEGLTVSAPVIYAYGRLVLWTLALGPAPSVPNLTDPEVRHIAVPDPRNAPYGRAAEEVLKHYGLRDRLRKKLVYGESLSQSNLFISSGAAEMGFTSLSTVLALKESKTKREKRGFWQEPERGSYSPVIQGMVILKRNRGFRKSANLFVRFLFSPSGQEILKRLGYTPGNPSWNKEE